MLYRVPAVAMLCLFWVSNLPAQTSLRGSRAAMLEQHRVAMEHDFTLLETPADVTRFVETGWLVALRGNEDYALGSVTFPYVRPEAKLFVERLGKQYRGVCEQKLVVTSATRPRNRQPRNASPLSVHPAGMAIDFRLPPAGKCRTWLERTLLALDGARVLNATRERRPPHYHVALYPRQYAAYVNRLKGRPMVVTDRAGKVSASTRTSIPVSAAGATHRVRPGEALSLIAERYGIPMATIRRANGMSSTRIYAGQLLRIPALVHRVELGEVLSLIAKRYGVSMRELQRANNLSSPDNIREGDRLFIPSIAEHTVVSGDNLSALADAYGTTVAQLAAVNRLSKPYTIRPSQKLLVPLGGDN